MTSRSMFRLSLTAHVAQLAVIFVSMMALRVPVIANQVSAILSQIPDGVGVEKYRSGDYFEPLSLVGWLVHFVPIVATLELMATMLASSALARNSGKPSRMAALAGIFLISHLGGIFIVLAHSLVGGINRQLEHDLTNAGFVLIRLHLFATAPLLACASLVSTSREWIMWSLAIVSAMAKLVADDVLQFGNAAGIVMNSLALLATLATPELDGLYKLFYILLAALPAYCPDSSNDVGHTMAASSVAACCLAQAYSCSRRTAATVTKKVEI